MENRLHYLGKCKPNELKQYFDKVYDYYRNIAIDRGYPENELIFITEKKYVKCYVKIEMEI